MKATAAVAGVRSPAAATRHCARGFAWLLALGIQAAVAAEYTVDFEDGSKAAYASGSVTLNGISWTLSEALIGTTASDWKNGTKSARLRGYTASALTMDADKPDGIGAVSFQHRRYGSDVQVPWRVEVSTNAGADWVQVGDDFTPGADVGSFSADVYQALAARIRVRAVNAGADNYRANVDDILLTDFGESPSNRPPVLAAIGAKSVAEGGSLTFLVSATDPDGTDAVTLSATNVPGGAVFDATTATPVSSNAFVWVAAGPADAYNVTFQAVDKDGTNSQTVAIQVYAENTEADLLISEYGEGSSNNKYIELFNGTGTPVDLSAYALLKQSNGAGAFGNNLALTGTLGAGETYVIVLASAAAELLALADLTSSSQALTFNGNDAVALYKNGVPLDVVGVVDSVTSWGAEVTLVRKSHVSVPLTVWDVDEWDAFTADDWSDVGEHTFDGGSNRPPVIAPLANQSITLNEPLSFLVRATDPDGMDEVTLWVTNLPAVATFAATNALGSVSNVCVWTDTSSAGQWTVTFYAADKDGTNSQSVTVEVVEAGVAADIIVSEYGEGSSDNKYIEVFNGTGRNIDLSGYSLRKSVNGAPAFTVNLPLAGILPHNDTFVVVNAVAAPALLAKSDLSTRSAVMTFNGNDPVALFKGEEPLDVVGTFGDINFGADVTLIRLSSVTTPTNVYDGAQWTAYGQDYWTDVGRHAMDGVESMSNFPPVFVSVPAQTVNEGDSLQFQVTANDSVDLDEILLFATELPNGATFATVSNLAAVSSTFEWVDASPAGVYTSRFAAVDNDGTSTLSVVVSVLPVLPSNQTLVVHFNEVRYNDAGDDDAEFIELIAHAGEELDGCTLVHYNGASSDGGIWTFTFPAFTVPDDGLIDTNGVACGLVLLSQTGGTLAAGADFLLPFDPASTNVPKAAMQNGPDGLVLYDSGGAVLDAVVWGTFNVPGDTGDMLVDDPGPAVVTRSMLPTASSYLHNIQPGSDDNSPQAPDNVIGDSGQNWTVLNASPGALNFGQTDGLLILTPQYPPPPPPPTGLLLVIW